MAYFDCNPLRNRKGAGSSPAPFEEYLRSTMPPTVRLTGLGLTRMKCLRCCHCVRSLQVSDAVNRDCSTG
jgi:hypothetical protein